MGLIHRFQISLVLLMIQQSQCDFLIGTGSNLIYHMKEDGSNLYVLKQFTVGNGPSFITLSNDKKYLYAVNEQDSQIQSYLIRTDISLQYLNQVASTGLYPCHLQIDSTGQFIGVANYGTNYALFKINQDGEIDQTSIYNFPKRSGSGPRIDRQEGSHPHQFFIHPSNTRVSISDLGTDTIITYSFNQGIMEQIQELSLIPGTGPRHLIASPFDSAILYGVNELSVDVSMYTIIDQGLLLVHSWKAAQVTSLADTAGEIVISKARFMYASIRGQNTISVFRIDSLGYLLFVQNIYAAGHTPRFIILSPSENELYVLHQDSDSMATFTIKDGLLTLNKVQNGIKSPQSLVFL